MIDEMTEFNQYYTQWKSGKNIYSDNSRFKKCYFSAARVLTVIARYYWFHDGETAKIHDKREKIEYIKKILYEFYEEVVINACEIKIKEAKSAESADAYRKERDDYIKGLKRYVQNRLKQKSNNFSFYSIIADAVNAGKLKTGKALLTGGEILHILRAAGYGKTGGETTPVILALVLVCYYKTFDREELPRGNYAPVVTKSVNAWLGNKQAWDKSSEWKKDRDKFSFIDIINVNGNVRYKIDFEVFEKSETGKMTVAEEDKTREFADDGNLKDKLLEAILYYYKKYLKNC